jgi:hypothetical protein
MGYDAFQLRKGYRMTSAASKRMRDQRPSKEDRERALGDALRLPSAAPRVPASPVVTETVPVDRPVVRRSRAKYAA